MGRYKTLQKVAPYSNRKIIWRIIQKVSYNILLFLTVTPLKKNMMIRTETLQPQHKNAIHQAFRKPGRDMNKWPTNNKNSKKKR